MNCSCIYKNFHDYSCYLTPKCHHCQARTDIGQNVCHSHFCPEHIRCEFCSIAENLAGALHFITCPKWIFAENQRRINNMYRRIGFNNIIHHQRNFSINLQHLRTECGEECPICRESNSNIKTRCGHYFHEKCLELWCNFSKSCPNCRNKNFF